MSEPIKEAVEAAEDICSMLGDTSTIREAVRVQSAIDAATAPLLSRIRELEADTKRLDWLDEHGFAALSGSQPIDLRDAIDAAQQQEKEQP